MDERDMYEAVKHAFIDALADRKTAPQLMRIDPFDAEDDDGQPVRVIGITEDDDMLKFVVIEEEEDGQIYPIARTTIYRKGSSAKGETSD